MQVSHKSYLPGRPWNVDETGHGTSVVEILSEGLDSKRHCIVIFKTTDGKARAEEYSMALIELVSMEFDVLLIALEDKGHYHKEIEWFDSLAKKSHIVVAGGNDGIELREDSCNIFPACLKNKLKHKERFHIVSGNGFNQGLLVDHKRNPCFKGNCGSSFSAARYAAELLTKE